MNRFFTVAKNILITIKYHRLLYKRVDFDFLNVSPAIVPLSCLPTTGSSPTSTTINELMLDGIFWGVPKKRRTIEKRLKRRFGVENYPDKCKILRPRDDLIICERCGDHHEYYTVCPTCYLRVKEETNAIKEAIKKHTNPLQPKDKEVLLKFQDEEEPAGKDQEQFKIIDVDRPRPKWFSKNLMIRSTSSKAYIPKDIIMDPKDLIRDNKKND